MREHTHKLFIYTALPCEAKPLVEHFKLKKDLTVQTFAVYVSRDICLTVTGLGKSAMAAGVAYTQALFAVEAPFFMLNLGVAGHQDAALGSLFLMDKITDAESLRSYYPSMVFSLPYARGELKTVSRPQLRYESATFFDMEASAFYETAVRFISSEFVFCLKVVSDNQHSSVENIQAPQVSKWIAEHVDDIESLLAKVTAYRVQEGQESDALLFDTLIQRYHFTVNERRQLKNHLEHWAVVTDHQPLELDESVLTSAKEVLNWLASKNQGVAFNL